MNLNINKLKKIKMDESSKEKEKLEENLIMKNKKGEKDKKDFDDFSIQGKIAFNDFKINLSTKYILNHDKETNLLIPSSKIKFSHQVTPWMKCIIKEKKGNLKFMTSMNPLSNFLLITKINLDNTAKIANSPIDVTAKYNFKNNLCLQLGIKDFNLMKEKIPTQICGGSSKEFNLWGNTKLNTGLFMHYSLNEKYVKNVNLNFDISNSYLTTKFNLGFDKKNKSAKTDKNLKINGEIKVSDKLSLGTEIDYNKEQKGTKVQLFTKYIIDQFTDFFGKWDDKDKSILFKMNHDFRGIFKLGITGRFTPVEGEKKEGKFRIRPFTTKTGISLDISEPVI
jgi:hypothetical protein